MFFRFLIFKRKKDTPKIQNVFLATGY